MDNEQLLALSKRGLLAGPHETREAFFARVQASPSLSQEHQFLTLQKLYNISPDWVKLIYSNEHLRFWEGGCTWDDHGKPVIQLRAAFAKKERLYAFYSKEELIDHEAVHAARGQFNSSIFEEIFAYQTSRSDFRKVWGPIIRTPKESVIYLVTLLSMVTFFFLPFVQYIAFILNVGLLSYGVIRLKRSRAIFTTLFKKLETLLGDERRVLPVMLHFSDEEMLLFSAMEPLEIKEYIQKNRSASIHLEQIYLQLFNRFG